MPKTYTVKPRRQRQGGAFHAIFRRAPGGNPDYSFVCPDIVEVAFRIRLKAGGEVVPAVRCPTFVVEILVVVGLSVVVAIV